jgi:IcmF-related N-terminal domain
MTNLFKRTGEAVVSLFGLVFPMLAWNRVASAESMNPVGRWGARLIAVLAMLGSLWMLNRWDVTGLRNLSVYASEFWLPLLAFCLYSMIWLLWWLYRVLSLDIEPTPSEFRDIDEAWDRALEALRKADVSLVDTPVFLVLGCAAGSVEAVFGSAGVRALVKHEPKDPGAPLQVTANRDAVWLTCPGICELGQHDISLTSSSPMDTSLASLVDATSAGSTLGADGTLRVQDILKGASLEEVIASQKRIAARKHFDSPTFRARLRHLCRLVARDRLGLCPINGILIVLPVSTADSPSRTQDISASCRSDLAVCHDTFRLRCPTVVLFSNMETLEGFKVVVDRLPAGAAGRRLGQEFPLVPDVDPSDVPECVQSAVEWVAETSFPSLVYSLLLVETPGGEGLTDVVAANAQLFSAVAQMRDRQARLAQLVRDCLPALPGEPILFRGCYFAGTGADAAGQAFVGGVLKKLIANQDHVTWTADYLGEDASEHRMATAARNILRLVAGLGILVAAVLAGQMLFHSGSADTEEGTS